ncbi:MAG: peroxiredoxin-like family protein, partial [Planctomycetota bacterium]
TGCAGSGDATADAESSHSSSASTTTAGAYTAPETPGLAVGEQAPTGIALADARGETVVLDDILDRPGPAVVMFYRGNWCPYCNRSLDAFQQRIEDFEAAGATLIAISPESSDNVSRTIGKSSLSYVVLSDTNGDAARAFNVEFTVDDATQEKYLSSYNLDVGAYNANGSWNLPAPAVYVIDDEGVIRHTYADWNYRKRADPSRILAVVERIN